MGMAYTPPSGWKIDEGPTAITSANQAEYASGPVECALVQSRLVDLKNTGGTPNYAPPLGWYVVLISHEKTQEPATVWITPEGQAVNIDECMNIGGAKLTDIKQTFYVIEKTKAPWWMWGLLGAGAFVLLRKKPAVSRGGKKKPSTKPRRRR